MCQENKRHKHADLIIAWANGAEIETKTGLSEWSRVVSPAWSLDQDYRIKPKPPVKKYRVVFHKKGTFSPQVTEGYYESVGDYLHTYNKTLDNYHWIQIVESSMKEFQA